MTSPDEDHLNSLQPNWALSWAERLLQLRIAANLPQLQQVSPASLAYLGDAVYELYVRTCYLMPPRRPGEYHQQVVAQVRAESQANHLLSLEPHLTDPEREILRRGRNATTGSPRRLDPQVYQQATSLETLFGHLYLTDPQRLTQLLAYLEFDPHS